MKKLAFLIPGLLSATSSLAQEADASHLAEAMLPYYVVFALLAICLLLVVVVAVYVLRTVRLLEEQTQREKSLRLGTTYVPSPGWWETLMQKLNASVPVDKEKNIELEHDYDGIKELDNHLPPWWKWLFYGTIGWAAVYVFVFHFSGSLPLSTEEYQIEIAMAEEQARQRKAGQPEAEAIDENNLAFVKDPNILEKGKNVFASNPCGSCHRNDGGGNTIGPNLTDDYWIHGGDVKSIFNTIKNGAVDKGMPAWGKAMSAQDLRDLTFYVMSLQGSQPPDAKAPQGELFKQATLETDSTDTQASL